MIEGPDPSRALFGAQPDRPKRGLFVRAIHRLARELVWPIVRLMELGHRSGRYFFRTEYKVAGGCDVRGACCHHILLEWAPSLDRVPILGRLVLWKLTRFYNFYDKGYVWEVEDGLMVRVLGCHALTADGKCGEYRTRPLFCRTYPEVPLWGRPQVLPGCGYKFVRRDGRPEDPELVQIGRRVKR
jgi:hypothetical protein